MTLVILGVFGGFLSFGFLGLFIGPALLAVAFTLVQAWRASPSKPAGTHESDQARSLHAAPRARASVSEGVSPKVSR